MTKIIVVERHGSKFIIDGKDWNDVVGKRLGYDQLVSIAGKPRKPYTVKCKICGRACAGNMGRGVHMQKKHKIIHTDVEPPNEIDITQ